MVDEFEARKRMFQGMGDFAKESRSDELRSKYAPPEGEMEPEVEEVPGTEEGEGGELPEEAMGEPPPEDIEALLAQMSPEEIQQLLAMN